MANTDQIRIPVGLQLVTEVSKVVEQFKTLLQQQLKEMSIQVAATGAAGTRLQTTGSFPFQLGGKQYVLSGTARTKGGAAKVLEAEAGNINIEDAIQVATTIKEIREKTAKAINQDAKRLADFKKSIRYQPLDVQATAINDYLSQFGDINNELNSRLRSVTQKLKTQDFKTTKTFIQNKDLSPEEQMDIWKGYLEFPNQIQDLARREIAKLKRQIRGRNLGDLKYKISNREPEDVLPLLEQHLASIGGVNEQIESMIRGVKRQIGKRNFQRTKITAESLPFDEQMRFWQDYMQLPNAMKDAAQKEINKLKNRGRKSQITDFKRQIQGMDPTEALKELDNRFAFSILPEDMELEVNNLRRALSRRAGKQKAGTEKRNFQNWMKQIQAMENLDQSIAELQKYIANPSSKFVDDARILQNRLKKNRQNQINRGVQERNRAFANNMLMLSGTGLGLLGAAGFPLLNVGFAAMSGGPVGAAVVGIATALGETSRALDEFRQKTVDAAKSLNFVSFSQKSAQARNQAIDAFAGAGSLSATRAADEMRLERMQRLGAAGLYWNRFFETGKRSFGETIASGGHREVGGLEGVNLQALKGMLGAFPYEYGRTFNRMFSGAGERQNEELLSAYRNMMLAMTKPTIGIENDPYEVWKRIQNAALTGSGDEDRRIQVEQLNIMRQQLDKLGVLADDKKPSAKSVPKLAGDVL